MDRFFASLETSINRFTEYTGKLSSWLVLLLVLLTCYDVMMRYLFQQGSVGLQELEWHIFALIFLLGSAYTLKHDGHVRVDILYRSHRLSDKHRAWIDVIGIVLFLMPFCVLILISSWPFAYNAYLYQEGSPDPGGLPYRFILKSALLLGFILLMIQAVAELIRNIRIIRQQQEQE
jgi:TRAP-type mannitol/chloroaromatic compound transport system permease small subunit